MPGFSTLTQASSVAREAGKISLTIEAEFEVVDPLDEEPQDACM